MEQINTPRKLYIVSESYAKGYDGEVNDRIYGIYDNLEDAVNIYEKNMSNTTMIREIIPGKIYDSDDMIIYHYKSGEILHKFRCRPDHLKLAIENIYRLNHDMKFKHIYDIHEREFALLVSFENSREESKEYHIDMEYGRGTYLFTMGELTDDIITEVNGILDEADKKRKIKEEEDAKTHEEQLKRQKEPGYRGPLLGTYSLSNKEIKFEHMAAMKERLIESFKHMTETGREKIQ